MYTDPDTGAPVNEIAKVRYNHDAMIDLIIAEPMISQNEIAAHFRRTPAWVSIIISSDAFQARLEERRKELIDPAILASIDNRFKAIAQMSLDRVMEKLSNPQVKDDFLIKSAQLAAGALGYGAKQPGASNGTGPSVVINMPGVAQSADLWAAKYGSGGQSVVIEQEPVKVSTTVDHEVPVTPLRAAGR